MVTGTSAQVSANPGICSLLNDATTPQTGTDGVLAWLRLSGEVNFLGIVIALIAMLEQQDIRAQRSFK
jgi:hypothetical protein